MNLGAGACDQMVDEQPRGSVHVLCECSWCWQLALMEVTSIDPERGVASKTSAFQYDAPTPRVSRGLARCEGQARELLT